MSRHPEMYRLYRFVRWYRRLRRPLDAETDFHFDRRFAAQIAWYWSSDLRAFLRARRRPA